MYTSYTYRKGIFWLLYIDLKHNQLRARLRSVIHSNMQAIGHPPKIQQRNVSRTNPSSAVTAGNGECAYMIAREITHRRTLHIVDVVQGLAP